MELISIRPLVFYSYMAEIKSRMISKDFQAVPSLARNLESGLVTVPFTGHKRKEVSLWPQCLAQVLTPYRLLI